MMFNLCVMVLLLIAIVVDEFLPTVGALMPAASMVENARLYLAPVFFFAASVAVPFPMMLLLAFMTGFIWDARYLESAALKATPVDFQGASFSMVESHLATDLGPGLWFGGSILLFGAMGTLMQGIRPLFKKGRWELPILFIGFVTALWLAMQYVILCFARGTPHFVDQTWTKLVTSTLLSMLASPLLFLCLHMLARATSYEIKYEGLRYRI
jgi:cell shape-determining protein MreD